MAKVLEAIYEDGVFKPVKLVDLTEKQRVRLTIEPIPSVAQETSGLIQADPKVIQQVALDDELLDY